MQIFNWLSDKEAIINQIWTITLIATVVLYILCNLLPDRIVGMFLPLHNVFKPQTNIDLDYQSIGYVLLHTTWATRITHSTIIIEAVLWFVIFESWHWTIPFAALTMIVIQSVLIGDKKFGIAFIVIGLLTYFGAVFTIQLWEITNAVLIAKVLLMLGGLMRMLSHSAELVPPLLINKTDQFEKLDLNKITFRLLLSSPIGYIGEFGSSLPNRILPIQVNYINQTLFGITPEKNLSWNEISESAKKVLLGGYSKLNSLNKYYESVNGGK
ncbi:hypothetical protein Emtol_3470 [Emticicia oligotrophica DSM 17448]|uniref:Rhomboid family intramembrane serine protease n=1 Tax=Emticicia oligotrophica (strain DSM 17448 / CIP 109782 / MTCC 6937 / GPTSA100-15) TaxID=929562 RepID=A0ABN4AQD7_EMTOG|nr:hypothetical protein [Emticicia oligotrophica]AFK04598.1 hypothetical protein Emtol_3470 [Emticicia oligotrophica DSM 17448]